MELKKSILYLPFLRFSGSEKATTHINTKCVDIAGSTNEINTTLVSNYLVAPFDCIVKYIDRDSNSVFFESIEEVLIPSQKSASKMCFRCAHMNDSEYNLLKMSVGRKFFQGEPCYFEGTKIYSGSIGKHIHIEFGKGTYTILNGYKIPWKKLSNGNHTITTTGGAIGIYDACYLHKNVIMQVENNPADDYLFKYADGSGNVSCKTYEFKEPLTNCKMKFIDEPYTMRKFPGGAAVDNKALFYKKDVMNVISFSPIFFNNCQYYLASGTVNGKKQVGYMQYDPEHVYPSGNVNKLFVKITKKSRVRSSMNKNSNSNIITMLSPGDLQKPRKFINCTAGDHDNGWIQLEDGNYIQYDTDCMYVFGPCKF